MKCFHFSVAGEKHNGAASVGDAASRVSRLSWARSFSASSSCSATLGFDHRLADLDAACRDAPPMPAGPPEGLRAFSFAELKAATKGFSRTLLIGEGGFGCVYRGGVAVDVSGEDGSSDMTIDVAVKQLNRNGLQGHKEWVTEVNFLGVLKHPNLVKLVGYCAEDDERGIQRLLVYELMLNKSLEDHLLSRISSVLSWKLRLKIAQDAARGLAYLHEELEFQLIFRDFKTSNILLDEDFNAKLSDFGFVRHGPASGVGHVSTSVVGTVGYAAPEYVNTGKLTAKSDVWSFGVVIYEILTGRRSLDRNLPRSEQKLLEWVKPYAFDPKKLHLIIDPRLKGQYCLKSAQMLVALANRCLRKQPKLRPRMSEVVQMLDKIIEIANGDATGAAAISLGSFSVPNSTELPKTARDDGNHWGKIFNVREMISLRNRSVGKLYWKSLALRPILKFTRIWT